MGEKSYRETLNLPKTDFPMKARLPEREPERIRRWDENRIYARMLQSRTRGIFLLHDGPPYSNGHIHLGQALNKILKDIVNKYWALQGYQTPFIPGWDNHGMPIENEVIKTDPEVARLLQDPANLKDPEVKRLIREKCRAFAARWVEIQKQDFKRLGVLGDWEHPYLTMDRHYEAEELRVFADFIEKGYIYRGTMPLHWCPHCRTALAMAEIEYKDKESPSLWFRVPLKKDPKGVLGRLAQGLFLVVWTTTPWTLVANRAYAFHPDALYGLVEVEGTRYLLVEARLEATAETLGWESLTLLARFKGAELEGMIFAHPLFPEKDSPAILADFVTLEEGTGVVHIAPGHGREDFEIGKQYGLEVFSPVDEGGNFTEEAGPEFQGLFVGKEGSEKAVEVLKRHGHFLHRSTLIHSYPHCWRCKNPLIFRATTQWFLSVDHQGLRQRALEEIRKVRWVPWDSINRIEASVRERPDWVLSRQRAWGVNIPAFTCMGCGASILDPQVARHVADIFEREGADAWFTHTEEELLPPGFRCPHCGGERFRKEMDILDVWFDSGISSLVVLDERGLPWPSDVYLEGPDQHRGWFNAALMVALAYRNQAPYRVVITHGWTLDEQGRAMHKSLGNVISPNEVADRYGADVLRLWTVSADYTQDMRLGPEILKRVVEAYRKIRNTYRFMLGNLYDFDPQENALAYAELLPVDRYMLHLLEELKEEAQRAYEDYEFHRVFHRYLHFMIVDLSAFYLDLLKDRLYTWAPDSPGRRSAQTALYHILRESLLIFAPILSFTTDEAYEHLPGPREESIFLDFWPKPVPERRAPGLKADFQRLRRVREKAFLALERARKEKKLIGDRLEARVILAPRDKALRELLANYRESLPELLIVSQVELATEPVQAPVSEEDEELWVGVDRAVGEKCARCWIWSPAVGRDPELPDLCPKCVEVIRTLT